MKFYRDVFDRIVAPENLFAAWDAFRSEKRNKRDVRRFEWNLEENIFALHRELISKTYQHGSYQGFYIRDPKQRHIHKAGVRDRVLHHAIFSVINPLFENTFISTSFSCRIGFGTHRGVEVMSEMARKIHKNGTGSCFVLKCDIKKFFDSVDHQILLSIIEKRIKDPNAIWLLRSIIESYASTPVRERERERESRVNPARAKGIPIGNLTSQLFANVYMNEFDQFVKHTLKIKNYIRYTDDFLVVADNREYLGNILPYISEFLESRLKLSLHPKKITIRPFHRGVDFLGYIIFPKHRLVRTKTKRRIFKKLARRIEDYYLEKINEDALYQFLQSYLGVLSHADTYHLQQRAKNQFWFRN